MTNPPNNWQDDARAHLRGAVELYLRLLNLNRLIRDALRADSYKAYQEAVAWFVGKEGEP